MLALKCMPISETAERKDRIWGNIFIAITFSQIICKFLTYNDKKRNVFHPFVHSDILFVFVYGLGMNLWPCICTLPGPKSFYFLLGDNLYQIVSELVLEPETSLNVWFLVISLLSSLSYSFLSVVTVYISIILVKLYHFDMKR